MENSKVSIIILTWNGIGHVANCLESVFKSNYFNYEVIVVDNGSKDGTPEMISQRFPQVRLILNKKNLGFTGGNNQGVKEATGNIFFLLNDDTKIHPDLIKTLVEGLESSSEIGIVGPKIYFMDKPNKIWFAGGKIDWIKSNSYHLGKNLMDKELSSDSKKEVDFITGCALMIKREVVDKVGLFDNKLFAFYEDADLCQKVKKVGYKVLYLPFGGVWHIKSATASRVFLDDLKSQIEGAGLIKKIIIVFKMVVRYLFSAVRQKGRHYRNRFIFFMRHAPGRYKITFLIRFILIVTPMFLWSIIYEAPEGLIKIAWQHRQK
ncbi:glycosyltransferase family 2 protein [Patescibacteria group bacterium]|nr:glycosyltransferase family 2 protein [Patescibacteria group bacterium]